MKKTKFIISGLLLIICFGILAVLDSTAKDEMGNVNTPRVHTYTPDGKEVKINPITVEFPF